MPTLEERRNATRMRLQLLDQEEARAVEADKRQAEETAKALPKQEDVRKVSTSNGNSSDIVVGSGRPLINISNIFRRDREARSAEQIAQDERNRNAIFDNPTTQEILRKKALGPMGQLKEGFQAMDDVVRVMAGKPGNLLEAAVTPGVSAVDSANRTAESAARLGGVAPLAEATGQVAQGMTLPGSMFNTPMKAAMSGGGLGILDTLMGRIEKGEPLGQDIEGIADAGTDGMAAGFAGYHLGRIMGNLVGRFSGKSTKLAQEAKRALDQARAATDKAGKAMDASGVVIKNSAMQRFLMETEKKLAQLEFTPQSSPNGWKAMNILRARVRRGEDITLRNFNEIRKQINSSIRSPNGHLKDSVNDNDYKAVGQITSGFKDFIRGLEGSPNSVLSGNAKEGVAAWNAMNKLYQKQIKAEKLGDIISRADYLAESGKKSFTGALQDELEGFFTTKTGKRELENTFSVSERKVLEELSKGDFTDQTINRLERLAGMNFLTPLIRVASSVRGAATGAEATRQNARQALSTVSDIPIEPRMAPQLGALGGLAGTANLPPILSTPQGGQAGMPSPQQGQAPAPAPSSGPPISPRLPRPLTPQSQSAIPQFGKVPE